MAAAMHAAASGQLGTCWDPTDNNEQDEDVEVGRQVVSVPPAEVVVLPEARSQEAARILTERGASRRPMARVVHYRRVLQCQEAPFDRIRKLESAGGPLELIRSWLMQFFPFLSVLTTLNLRTLRADVIAGLTVGVMVIPQSMSYAGIAGLSYKYGMYSACMPTIVYALLGQSRQLAVGPVAMVSLLIEAGLNGLLTEEECPASYSGGVLDDGKPQHQVCPEQYAQLAILTAMVVGVMQIVARVLNLGFLVSFLGHPVTSGFTSGAAIIIGLSQIKYIVGFDIPKSERVYETVWNLAKDMHKLKWMTMLLGLCWLAFLITSKRLSKRGGKFALIGPISPLVSCIAGTLLLFWCTPLREEYHVKIVGEVPSGLFPMSIQHWQFGKIAQVIPTALSTCLIGYMESIAIGKNLAAKHGYDIDAGQELLALGVSNLVGSMFSCYPVTGSFSRSAVANATGALTQLSGMITALVMLCTLMFLTSLFYYLPSFVLAAIVISSIIPLVAYDECLKLWRLKKVDCGLWVVAFIGTLFLGVLQGILLAVVLSLVIVIYESVRPQITILWRIPGTSIYRNIKQESNGSFIPNVFIARIGSSMYFANASFIKDVLLAYVEDLREVNPTEYIVLEMTPVISIDSTAVHVIQDIVQDFRSRGIQVAFAMVGNRVEKTMRNGHVVECIGKQWFFSTVNQAVTACLLHQQNKRLGAARVVNSNSTGSRPSASTSEAEENPMIQMMLAGDEIGFSDDLHHGGTTVFVSLSDNVPLIMSAFDAVLHNQRLSVTKAHMEVASSDAAIDTVPGVRFTYVVKSMSSCEKLDDKEKAHLKSDLKAVIDRFRNESLSTSTSATGEIQL